MKKPYPATKPSGVEWLGDIPEHWESPRLSAHFYERNEKVNDTDYPPLSVTMKGIVPQLANVAKTNATDNRKMVCCNDFVINSRSDRKGSSGTSDYEGSVSLISIVLTPREYDPKFAHHLFRSYNFQEEFYRYGSGIVADLWSTRFSEMKNIRIPVFSIPEQQQIARYLDGETGRIDGLVLEKQRFVELLKEKRQALISHVVTKGLNPAAPLKPSGIDWIGDVPEHWKACSYRYMTQILRGKFGCRPRNDPSLYDGKYPFIQTGDVARANRVIKTYKQTLNEKGKSVSAKFPKGTLVMAIAANVGDTAILGFDAYCPDSIVGFYPNKETDLDYLRFSFIALLQILMSSATISTQLNLNIDRISNVKTVFPPLSEQQQIADYLDRETGRIDELVAEVGRSIALLKEERTALISAAVTGKIDVREKM